ncbi:MAG TPA: aldehyde dehydrogenase family protein [Acidimicrobiales bacterium]|nr:aldehyde dehydrogenase family protein [Acidimicrobiales bacterium]
MNVDSVSRDAGCFIAGKWQQGDGALVRSVDPAKGTVIAETPSASSQQVSEAIGAARQAFDGGEWSRLTARDRSRLLNRLAELIERDKDDLVELVVTEVGSPVTLARSLQVGSPIMYFRWFADAALRGPRDGLEQPMPLHHDPVTSSSMLLREPAGVVAAITAYNYPLNLSAWKLGPAFASGCSAVLLPSPKGLLCTIALVRLIEEAGFPPGAVNLVFGPPAVTEQLVSSDLVDMVSFTGSAAVGAKVMALAAPTLKKVVLELGGKSPNILLPGVDTSATVGPSILRFVRNAGQGCGATTRTLVPRSEHDSFVAESAAFMRALVVDDPHHDSTVIGPLITDEHRRNVEGYLSRAVDAGADVVTGGGRPGHLEAGFFLEPTLVTGVSNDAEVSQEELFAPVGVVIPYDDVSEALALANATRYGLNANVWGPTADAIEFARKVRSGTVTINGGGGMRPDAPWGGYRESGVGRECGEEGFREFFEVKHVQWPVENPVRLAGLSA